MYAQDYDEMFPDILMGRDLGNGYPYCHGWNELIMPYVKNNQVFRCPSAYWGNANMSNMGVISGGYGAVREVLGYAGGLGYKAEWWGGWPNLDAPGYGQPIAAMTAPAENILVCDSTNYCCEREFWHRTDNTSHPTVALAQEYNGAYYVVDSRHNGQANACFADGHVKSLPQGIQNCPWAHPNPKAGAGPWVYYQFH